jgi:hypothetical protein
LWKSFKDKVYIARQLSLSEWLLLAEAWWVLFGFFLALRLVSLERLNKTFRLIDGKKVDPSGVLVFAHRLQKLVSLASRLHLLSITCLIRACALHWMLGRFGIPSQLCIGVNKSLVGIHAHAWVEIMGQAIGEPEDIDERFKVLKPIQCLNTFANYGLAEGCKTG